MDVPERLARARQMGSIRGLALATIENGLVRLACAGHSDAECRTPVTDRTVFPAASLSKPVFAYLVLQLVDQGVLSLDAPLAGIVDYVPGDAQAADITAAQVLSHTSGLPNWRSADEPLQAYFRPGERFSYSGEGFVFLQRAVERLTGEALDAAAHRLVFGPLGMTRSTFDPARRFDAEAVLPGALPIQSANAAASLRTTAHDYGLFLKAVLVGEGLGPATSRAWMEVRTLATANFAKASDPRDAHQLDPAVGWGLGWGLETASRHFFQWGANNGYVSFAIGSRAEQAAFVLLTTGFTGLDCLGDLVELAFPGPRASLAWLGRRTDL